MDIDHRLRGVPGDQSSRCGATSKRSRRRRHGQVGNQPAESLHTAMRLANQGNWRHSTALGGFSGGISNGPQRSVNRKVQGSNPCSGAKSELKSRFKPECSAAKYINRTATVRE